jgi:hypothetical protein
VPAPVSLIEIYASLRENNIPKPAAAAIAIATYRVLDHAAQRLWPRSGAKLDSSLRLLRSPRSR